MRLLKRRILLWTLILLFFSIEVAVGDYLFGKYQVLAEAIFLLIISIIVISILLTQAQRPNVDFDKEDERKLAANVLERVSAYKRHLNQIIRKIFKC